MWQKVAKFKGAEYFCKALYVLERIIFKLCIEEVIRIIELLMAACSNPVVLQIELLNEREKH